MVYNNLDHSYVVSCCSYEPYDTVVSSSYSVSTSGLSGFSSGTNPNSSGFSCSTGFAIGAITTFDENTSNTGNTITITIGSGEGPICKENLQFKVENTDPSNAKSFTLKISCSANAPCLPDMTTSATYSIPPNSIMTFSSVGSSNAADYLVFSTATTTIS